MKLAIERIQQLSTVRRELLAERGQLLRELLAELIRRERIGSPPANVGGRLLQPLVASRLARVWRCSERAASRAIAEAQVAGLVEHVLVERPKGGAGRIERWHGVSLTQTGRRLAYGGCTVSRRPSGSLMVKPMGTSFRLTQAGDLEALVGSDRAGREWRSLWCPYNRRGSVCNVYCEDFKVAGHFFVCRCARGHVLRSGHIGEGAADGC